jgi:hypothetical protein
MNGQISMSKTNVRDFGRWFAQGVLQELALIYAIGFALLVVLTLIFSGQRDDSDTADKRSGMKPRRDALTGCEYLETSKGAITPRLGRDGKQVCR